jgi:phage terminase small subunit
MTKRTDSPLSKRGDGRGKGVTTKPQPKKRGAVATVEAKAKNIALVRATAPDTSAVAHANAGDEIDPTKPLTEKQRLFVKFWAQGESILSASSKAGYNDGGTYAYRLARYPNVLRIYEEEKRLYAESCQMTRKQVMDGLMDAIEMAKLMAEPATMVSGWREIGKLCGYYEPVKRTLDINISGNIVHERMNRLSDAELLKLIQQGVEQEVLTDGDDEENDQ